MRNDFQEGAFLAHSAKGTSWKNVKYLKKVKLASGKYYYIYTQAQLNAWNKSHSIEGNNVLSDKAKADAKKQALSNPPSLEQLQKERFVVKGNTTAEKKANLEKSITDGEKKINEILEKQKKEKEDSKKNKKSSGSGSSGKSKGSGKGSSGGSSKKSGAAKEDKEKATSAKAASQKTASKATEKKTTEKAAASSAPVTLDTLKKIYGTKDEDVTTHDVSASDFKNEMLSKYKDGSFGYLMAGDKAYKWVVDNGQLVIKDFDTDKDVSFDTYLKDVKQFKEFQTNKNKKK